jgi:hypothetical protein
VSFGLHGKFSYDGPDKKTADDRYNDYPEAAQGGEKVFCSPVSSHLDETDEADKKYGGKAGGDPYNNCHNQQYKPLSRGKMVKQFCQVSFDHKRLGMTGLQSFLFLSNNF